MQTILIFFTAIPCLSTQQYFNQPQNAVHFPSFNFPPFAAQFQPPSSNPQPNNYHPEFSMGQFQLQPPNGFQQPQDGFQHPLDGYQQSHISFQQPSNVYQQPNHYQHEYQQYQPPSDYHQHYDYSDGQYETSDSRRRGEYMESCECECMRCDDPKPCCEQVCYECQLAKPVPENPTNLVFVPYPYPIVLPAQRQPPTTTSLRTSPPTTPTTTSTTTTTTTTATTNVTKRVKIAERYSVEMTTPATTTTTPTTTTPTTTTTTTTTTPATTTTTTTTTTTPATRKIPNTTESLIVEDYPWSNWAVDGPDELGTHESTCEPGYTENFFEMLRKNQKKYKERSSKLRSMGMRPIKSDWSPRYGIVPISEDLLVSLIAGSREVKRFNTV